jgi:hypothetical protein
MPLPDPMIEVLAAFGPLFTAPTWRKLMILLTGTLVAHGRRTVAAALRHSGHEKETSFSTFHQVLNRARWSPSFSQPSAAHHHRGNLRSGRRHVGTGDRRDAGEALGQQD